jgi:hypothetical protein
MVQKEKICTIFEEKAGGSHLMALRQQSNAVNFENPLFQSIYYENIIYNILALHVILVFVGTKGAEKGQRLF